MIIDLCKQELSSLPSKGIETECYYVVDCHQVLFFGRVLAIEDSSSCIQHNALAPPFIYLFIYLFKHNQLHIVYSKSFKGLLKEFTLKTTTKYLGLRAKEREEKKTYL